MAKSPQGFIVVLPGEIIEIAQDDDISWLTLFYALPKELAEKYPDALKIPRSPYEVLYEGSYGALAKSEMLKSEKSLLQSGECSRSRRTGWRNWIGYSSVFMRIWWVENSLKLGSKCSQTITKRNRLN